jgi:hypothetical protein
MNVKSDEMLAGWKFHLRVSPSEDAYLLTMRAGEAVLATDESGLIYQGRVLA